MLYAVIGEKYKPLLDSGLSKAGITPLWLPDNPDVSHALCGHADLSVFCPYTVYGNNDRKNTLFLAPYLKDSAFAETLKAAGADVRFINSRQGSVYPKDVLLNAKTSGNRVFLNRKTIAVEILDYISASNHLSAVNINQGYSACCTLDCRGRIITSDNGIYSAAKASGSEAVFITPGFISLPGYSYGFIGGSAFMICPDCIGFTGSLDKHPDREIILSSLKRWNIRYIFLSDKPIFDIGGAIIINNSP